MVDFYPLLLRKKEATYGTDAMPTAALNAALTSQLTVTPIANDRLARNLDKPVRGRSKDGVTNQRQTLSYRLEIAGSGDAGTAPAWMEDLEFCGMAAPVLVADTTATQQFAGIGATLSSGSFYSWNGNQKRIGTGGRGTFGWDFTAGAYPYFTFDITALVAPTGVVSDANPGTPTLDRWKDPVEVNTANTEVTLDGFAVVMRSFNGAANATVTPRNLVGANYIQRGNHGITGQLVVEAPTIAAKNYFTTLQSGGEIVLDLTHGTEPGNIVDMTGAHLQITAIELSNEDDILMATISYGMNVGVTNDDLVIVAR